MYYVPGMLDMLGTRYGYQVDVIVKWVLRGRVFGEYLMGIWWVFGGYLVGISWFEA